MGFYTGYGKVLEAGLFAGSVANNKYTDASGNVCYKYAYVRLQKEIAFETKDINPLTIAGWDFARNFIPRIAYPGSEPANMGGSNKPLKTIKKRYGRFRCSPY